MPTVAVSTAFSTATTAKYCNASTEYSCGDGTCIPKTWLCDSLYDCPNHDDELHCSSYVCGAGRFLCDDRRTCIQANERCDGKFQCPDHSDEDSKYCAQPTKASSVSTSDLSVKDAIIIGVVVGGVVLLILIGCIIYWVRSSNWYKSRSNRYSMQQVPDKSVSGESTYTPPPLAPVFVVQKSEEKPEPTHVWFPVDAYEKPTDIRDVGHIDMHSGDKYFILRQ